MAARATVWKVPSAETSASTSGVAPSQVPTPGTLTSDTKARGYLAHSAPKAASGSKPGGSGRRAARDVTTFCTASASMAATPVRTKAVYSASEAAWGAGRGLRCQTSSATGGRASQAVRLGTSSRAAAATATVSGRAAS